jgi:hypothetical protein
MPQPRSYAVLVNAQAARYQARPGRTAVVVPDLADLHGAAALPLRLFWSPPGRVFDLDDPDVLRAMYEIVLGEAICEDELAGWLDGATLAEVWADLFAPKRVWRAWEERQPEEHRPAAGGCRINTVRRAG